MPLDPTKDATPHPRGGAIRIYEAIKKACLHDRVFLVMMTNRGSDAEIELGEIRADQRTYSIPWAITHYPKPETTPGPAPLERLLKPDDWKYAVGRAIGCCQNRDWKTTFVRATLQDIVGNSALLTQAKIEAERYANRRIVLLTGETGSGKELIAEALHWHSNRCPTASKGKKSPVNYAAVNCQTLVPTLVESELFGHGKGAFAGAHAAKQGYFERFRQGTVFLDELGSDPVVAKEIDLLLRRVLSKPHTFRKVGLTEDIHFEGTVILGGSQLAGLLESEATALDFLSRVGHAARINVPSLRERLDDIVPLAQFFLKRACAESQNPVKELSREVKGLLTGYSWPGNVRELEQMMEGLAGKMTLVIRPEQLPEKVRFFSGSTSTSAPQARAHDPTREQVIEALKASHGNRTQAACLLFAIPSSALEKERDAARHRLNDLIDRLGSADPEFASSIPPSRPKGGRPPK